MFRGNNLTGAFDNLLSTNSDKRTIIIKLLRKTEWVYATFRDDCGFCTEDNQGSSGGRQLQGETATIHLSLLNVQVLPGYLLYKDAANCIKSCICKTDPFLLREGSGYQIGWIFGKNPNGHRPPPLIFGNYIAIFYSRYGYIYARRYEGEIVWNACTWFPEIRTILIFLNTIVEQARPSEMEVSSYTSKVG